MIVEIPFTSGESMESKRGRMLREYGAEERQSMTNRHYYTIVIDSREGCIPHVDMISEGLGLCLQHTLDSVNFTRKESVENIFPLHRGSDDANELLGIMSGINGL